jgi:hypothetical protein
MYFYDAVANQIVANDNDGEEESAKELDLEEMQSSVAFLDVLDSEVALPDATLTTQAQCGLVQILSYLKRGHPDVQLMLLARDDGRRHKEEAAQTISEIQKQRQELQQKNKSLEYEVSSHVRSASITRAYSWISMPAIQSSIHF